jgi:hypothetical protein
MSEIGDLLERFRRGPELVAVSITGAAGAELDYVPAPGKWSIRHLADAEAVAVDRFRRVIAEDNPALVAYDQDAWARNLDYSRRKISHALETFRRTRGENHELLKELPEEVFGRVGTHSKLGPVSLLQLLRIYAEHAEVHSLQLKEVRQAYKASKGR